MLKHLALLLFATVMLANAASFRERAGKMISDPVIPNSNCFEKCKGSPLELSFVVDGSASIWPENFTYGLEFLEDFVDGFDISPTAVRVSMVTFGEVAYRQDAFGFGAYDNKEDLKLAISEVPYRSGLKTNTSGGIWHMLHQQIPEARPHVRRVVVVLTDGNSQETALTKEAADDAREAGLEVFAIGVGHQVSVQELRNIATDDDHVLDVATYKMLEHIKDVLQYKACGSTPHPPCKMKPVDLAFVIDSSASVGEGNFSIGMKFVTDFIEFFAVNPITVRVAAITFADGIYVDDAFGFDSYDNKKDVKGHLESIQWRHGVKTKTGAGIAYMRTQLMARARPSAAHVGIVITDGRSQESDITAAEAALAQDDGIVMYAVGVGEVGAQLSQEELDSIAGDPSRVLTATSYGQLNLLKDRLAVITCEGVSRALTQKNRLIRPRTD